MNEPSRQKGAAEPLQPEEIAIEKQIVGGRGMGKTRDGRLAFVPGGFAGDRVRLIAGRPQKSFVEITEHELIEPSPDRIEPPCPACSTCGGCDWMPLTQSAQNAGKAAIIRQALERIGRFSKEQLPQPIVVHSSPSPLRYRNRVRLQVKAGRVGFFSRRSHELIEVEDCLVASEPLWEAVCFVRETVRANASAFEPIQHVEVRVFSGSDSGSWGKRQASAWFVWGPKRPAQAQVKRLREATRCLQDRMEIRLGDEKAPLQHLSSSDAARMTVPVGGFTQVNEGVNDLLVTRVLEIAQLTKSRTFLDLYCGCGNFALPLAAAGLNGVGVERDRQPIEAAQLAAREQDLPVEFHAADSRKFMDELGREGRDFDMAVVDPPRAGAKEVLQHLVDLGPTWIVMISCDPATFARDLRTLVDGGYVLETLDGFDMFPQTHHVESLALLKK